ncbi:MAG: SPOR domain-containing protein, partial [bacterium]
AEDVFSDTWGLEEREKKAVYLATRGLESLKGAPLMNGYEDGAFRPRNSMTRAEAAGFTSKLRRVSPKNLEPPYSPPWKPAGAIASPPPVKDEKLRPWQETAQPKPGKPRKRPYWLVALSTAKEQSAHDFAATLSEEGLEPTIVEEKTHGSTFYHVLFGVYSTIIEAEAERRRLEVSGYQVCLSGPPEEESFLLPSLPPQGERKKPEKEKGVEEIPLYNTPPIPDNLDTTGFNSPTTEHERYMIITR